MRSDEIGKFSAFVTQILATCPGNGAWKNSSPTPKDIDNRQLRSEQEIDVRIKSVSGDVVAEPKIRQDATVLDMQKDRATGQTGNPSQDAETWWWGFHPTQGEEPLWKSASGLLPLLKLGKNPTILDQASLLHGLSSGHIYATDPLRQAMRHHEGAVTEPASLRRWGAEGYPHLFTLRQSAQGALGARPKECAPSHRIFLIASRMNKGHAPRATISPEGTTRQSPSGSRRKRDLRCRPKSSEGASRFGREDPCSGSSASALLEDIRVATEGYRIDSARTTAAMQPLREGELRALKRLSARCTNRRSVKRSLAGQPRAMAKHRGNKMSESPPLLREQEGANNLRSSEGYRQDLAILNVRIERILEAQTEKVATLDFHPVLLGCFWFILAAARDLAVEITGTDTGDCTTPCRTLDYAIRQLSSGDRIKVGVGTFAGSLNRNLSPGDLGKANFSIEGYDTDLTIFDVERAGRFMYLDAAAGEVVIQKLTVRNGYCSALSGDRNGAGFKLVQSPAKLRDIHLRDMDCSFEETLAREFNGGGLYLVDSIALVQRLRITDSVGNHGAGVATWGADVSRIEDSIFERLQGLRWGGALLTEENSLTEFHRCRFSRCYSPYGGVLDDGGQASPLFADCVFDQGTALHGSAYYGYGMSATRFRNVIFQSGRASSSAAIYLTATVSPSFTNITVVNNTANVDVAGVRSFVPSGILFKNSRFIDNHVPSNGADGAIQAAAGGLLLEDCLFEGNGPAEPGGTVGITASSATNAPSNFRRVVFRNNGHAVVLKPSSEPDAVNRLHMEDVVFESNVATDFGGALEVSAPADVTVHNAIFRNNAAQGNGGALAIFANGPARIEINSSTVEGNLANGQGGGIYCAELANMPAALVLNNVEIRSNEAYGSGGGLSFDCTSLDVTGGSMSNNSVLSGKGGALQVGPNLRCGSDPIFKDVTFKGNAATTGAVAFFSSAYPSCAIPVLEDDDSRWNPSVPSAWHWTDFSAAVSGQEVCGRQSLLTMEGFPGMSLSFGAVLLDSFNQVTIDDTLQLELVISPGSTCLLDGVLQHRITQGLAAIQSVKVLAIVETIWNSICKFKVRLPRSIITLKNVVPLEVHLHMGPSAVTCPSGWISSGGQQATRECQACPAGNFAVPGALSCTACPAGRYNQEAGTADCLACPAGHGCPAGTSIPAPCPRGYHQNQEGGSSCLRCPLGTYTQQTASANCTECALGMITLETGSDSASSCLCSDDSFMVHSKGCTPCPAGMLCAAGLAPPLQQAGYWAEVEDAGRGLYSVFQCRNAEECPEGQPEICAPGRTNLACNNCLPKYYPTGSGDCKACEDYDTLGFYVAVIVMWCGAAILSRVMSVGISQSSLSKLTVLAVGNQPVMVVQTFSTISKLAIAWPEPVKTLIEFADLIMMINLDFVKIACVSQHDHPVVKLLGQLLAFPALALGLGCVWLIQKYLKPNQRLDHLINVLGFILFAFFLSLALATMLPFQCVSNPNGTSSMANNPGVLCYQSEDHFVLVAVAGVGIILYPVSIIAWATWATYLYPSRAATGKGIATLYRYRFFFQRFTPQCYFFGLFILVRNFLLALAPIVLVPVPALQIVAVGTMLLASLALQTRLWPWRTRESNVADLLMMQFVVIVLLGVSPLLEIDEAAAATLLGTLLCVPVLAPLVLAVLVTIWMGWRSLQKAARYDAFLCHHKGGAGALARYIKIQLTTLTGCSVFLDADCLESLDGLFDIVREQTKNFVVILTQELPKRMWCAGEVATAHKKDGDSCTQPPC
eukprot:s4380_g4.t3